MRELTLVSSLTTRFFFELALGWMPILSRRSRASTLQIKYLHCQRMAPWLLLPRILLFLDTLRPRDTVGSESVAAMCSGLCARSWVAKTETVSLRTVAFFFPLVTDTFFPPSTSINPFRLLIIAPDSILAVEVSGLYKSWDSIFSDESPCRTIAIRF